MLVLATPMTRFAAAARSGNAKPQYWRGSPGHFGPEGAPDGDLRVCVRKNL